MPEPISSETLTILQYAALAAGTAIGGAIAAYFGVRAKQRRNGDSNREDHPNRNGSRGVQWWWDGPVGKTLETLQSIYHELKQMREDNARHADERNRKLDDQTDILRDIEGNTRDSRTGRPARRN